MKKKILFSLIVFMLVFAIGAVVKTRAGTEYNATGWLWGGGAESDGVSPWDGTNTNVGWISMNSTNCDNDPTNGTINDPDCIDAGASGPSVNYGVDIPLTGNVTGYAWSENIGWISFNSADLVGCPIAPCEAKKNIAGTRLQGWARIISIRDAAGNSGGWEGWLNLEDRAPGSPSYGITINAGGNLSGYAWSASSDGSAELGWIDFSQASIVSTPMFIVCPDSFPNLIVGDNLSLSAYYIASGSIDCSNTTGATDVTSDLGTNWSSSDSSIASVDNGAQKGRVTGVNIGGPVNIKASYLSLPGLSAIIVVSVPADCGDGNVDIGEECDNGVDDGDPDNGACPAICSTSCTLNNCSGADWIEVTP